MRNIIMTGISAALLFATSANAQPASTVITEETVSTQQGEICSSLRQLESQVADLGPKILYAKLRDASTYGWYGVWSYDLQLVGYFKMRHTVRQLVKTCDLEETKDELPALLY